MSAARRAGLPVAEFHLADNGGLFVMRRFDRTDDGPLGFEDMCSLQALGTAQKYSSTYERVAKTLKNFIVSEHLPAARKQFFATLVLSSMVGNGDAHLKNFGVLYSADQTRAVMAPVYDVVTTRAYLPQDVPALALSGTKKWWPRRMLEQFAVSRLSLTRSEIDQIFEQLATAVMETRTTIPAYIADHPEFREVGERMMEVWAGEVGKLG